MMTILCKAWWLYEPNHCFGGLNPRVHGISMSFGAALVASPLMEQSHMVISIYSGLWLYRVLPSPFFPGILLSSKPPKTLGKWPGLKRTMAKNNGELTPRFIAGSLWHHARIWQTKVKKNVVASSLSTKEHVLDSGPKNRKKTVQPYFFHQNGPSPTSP